MALCPRSKELIIMKNPNDYLNILCGGMLYCILRCDGFTIPNEQNYDPNIYADVGCKLQNRSLHIIQLHIK